MTVKLKTFIKSLFGMLDIDIKKLQPYQKNRFAWIEKYNINTLIDIGANIGQFALEIGKKYPDIEIYSFEPIRDVFEEFRQNTHKYKRIKGFNIALGDINGSLKILKNDFSASSSILEMADLHKETFPYTKNMHEENINIKRLDDFIQEQGIKLKYNLMIKLDVQGYEDRVLKGGMHIVENAKIIIIEVSFFELYANQILFSGIYNTLTNTGYKYIGALDIIYHPKTGIPLSADAIFIRD